MSYEGTTKGVVVGDFQSPFGHYNNFENCSIPNIEKTFEPNINEQFCDTKVTENKESIDDINQKVFESTVPHNSTVILATQNHSSIIVPTAPNHQNFGTVQNHSDDNFVSIDDLINENEANKIPTQNFNQLEVVNKKPEPAIEHSPPKGITTFGTVLSFFDGNPPAD